MRVPNALRLVALVAVVSSIAGLTTSAALARTHAIDSYCSPTGDYCIAILRSQGRVKFALRTFSFRGRYEVCIEPRGQSRECLAARLVRSKYGIYASRVDFARNFLHRARGRYSVSWHYQGSRIGPVLHFQRR